MNNQQYIKSSLKGSKSKINHDGIKVDNNSYGKPLKLKFRIIITIKH
jgi:hypothetical protein